FQQISEATFEIVVVGRRNDASEVDILMVEAGATETAFDLVDDGAPVVTEEVVASGLEEAKGWINEAISAQEELAKQAGPRANPKKWIIAKEYGDDVYARVVEIAQDRLLEALSEAEKVARERGLDELNEEIAAQLADEFPDRGKEVSAALRKLTKTLV